MKTDYLLLPEPLNRLNDVFFKYVLASPERKHITIAFLNAVLNYRLPKGEKPIEIEDLEFLDRETTVLAEGMKGARFDVFVRSKDGKDVSYRSADRQRKILHETQLLLCGC
ncbi:MAG: PD-(D/E)XK nuclease family transposase [Synergistaceae bacterium]|nr:PD-(D/E)XK nuclease family transposase [Synergistaceae bacterium]